MAAVSLPGNSIDWTIADLQAEKNRQRGAWTEEFHKNRERVAQTIAESIAQEMFGKLQDWLGDPYRPTPVCSDGLILKYSLSLPDNTSEIKQWMQDTVKLEPFASWFEGFEQKSPLGGAVGVKSYSGIVSKVYPSPIDTRFFQSLMTFVGQQVAICLRGKMEEFRQNPVNASLQGKIEWYRGAEQSGVSSLSANRQDNSVHVSLWVETEQARSKSFWSWS